MCTVCLNGTYPNCPVCEDDSLPRVDATITIVDNENQLEFDCPNCGSFNEIHTCEDENIAYMKVNHEYDYECMYCKTKLELIINE